ncbi:ankyrin domain protein [Metarhizium anisopliae]
MVEDVLGWADGWSEASLGLEHAFEHAVSRWNVEVVQLLLARFNYSPLCINVCLCRAADFKSPLPPYNRAERGGLDYVNQQQLISCLVDVLLEKGADPNRRDAARETALHYLGSPAHSIDRRGPKWCLHETGIRLLLQHGASVTIRDELGNTPLHYAAFGSNLHIFSLYTTALPVDSLHGNVLESIKNDSGEALLHWAAAGKKIDILWFLLSSGADVHVANDNGWSPLTCALHSPVSCNSDEYLCAALLQNTASGKNSPRSLS